MSGKAPSDAQSQVIERIRQIIDSVLTKPRPLPESTYRLQLHAGFTFREAASIAPYLRELGITHCYPSPYLRARPGSTHGYDIVDHASINPEIGSEDDFNSWLRAMADNGLGQIVDTVPNHMGVGTNENAWWNDAIENGPASRFAGYFDIAWYSSPRPELHGKLLLPVLGEPYGEALESGKLVLVFQKGAFEVCYLERRFPLDPRTCATVLGRRLEELERTLGKEAQAFHEYQSVLTACHNLPSRAETAPEKVAERSREKEIIKRRLAALATESAPIREFIEQNIALFNGQPGNVRTFDQLHELLEHQAFRLSYWRVALDEINYRRFFDINDLAALSIEHEDVFVAVHALLLRLAAQGKIDGFRIDHPDGLYDPAQYFRRLQEHFVQEGARHAATSDPELASVQSEWESSLPGLCRSALAQNVASTKRWPCYVIAEKILSGSEALPEPWATAGTSGYEFLNVINALFVDPANADAMSRVYHEFLGDDVSFDEIAYRKKLLVLQASLAGELHMLTHQLDRLAQKSRSSRDFTFNTLRLAVRATIACFPVYRSYIAEDGPQDDDRRNIQLAIRRAIIRNPLISRRVFQFVRAMLLMESPASFAPADVAEQRRFVGKFQQVTSPVTAKGLEDTAFYVYNRLLSLNEVGGQPARFGLAPDAVHAALRERQAKWPFALSPLSTHDTKRSEDVRARLNVLSEMPQEWRTCVHRWTQLNRPHKETVEDRIVPEPNDEYMFYQSLLGIWPFGAVQAQEWNDLIKRLAAFMEKATREAKERTSWIYPNPEYDGAIARFVAGVLDPNANAVFLDDFRAFQHGVSQYGIWNALAQTLLKLTAPGVPDTYQGTETWDFSLVDPDNRRRVDYERRQHMLQSLASASANPEGARKLVDDLVAGREDGRIKMYITMRALHHRRAHPGLFTSGAYIPLSAAGDKAEHVFAFARNVGDHWALVVAPRLIRKLIPDTRHAPLGDVWGRTHLSLGEVPANLHWRNLFTSETQSARTRDGANVLDISEMLARFPVALLIASKSAGS